ncbi:solute carrier family 22 member 11 isoform X6 [Mustela lutreola]|uniref:solute carrier family 22 member 11 isoform X6 n=1 Tax=Mustela lutreola TaxID=9666 RepID=UPI002797387B|nr:solute carrier family 22 member 11 isoform X6 [Mustela lutreola]
MAFAELLERAGGVGLFQALQVLTLLLPSILVPSQMLIENFLAAVPGHRCWVRMLDNSSEAPANLSSKDLLTVSIPPGLHREPHQCRRFRQPQWQLLDPNATATNWSEAATELCVDGWVYDRSTFTSTIVSEWDLVCDNQGLKPMGQSIYMAGVLLGSISWGFLSDRFGRKPVLSWCCLQVALANTGTIFASNFLIYCGLRFLSAFGAAGIIMIPATLMVEWTTTRRRAVTVTVLGCSYSLGQMALGALAFTLRDWRALQTAVSMPFFAIFLISWWLPESARWLIITGKPERALQELRKVARINGHKEATKSLTVEVLTASMEEEVASVNARRSVLDLFLVPTLRWRSCCPLWSCGLTGPGHHHFPAQLPGSPHDAGQLPGHGWPLHPGQHLRPTRFADRARGLRRAGKGMLWHKLNLHQCLQARALPNYTADDSRWLPAVGRSSRGCDGPPSQDDSPGRAPAGPRLLRCHPHRVQPHPPVFPPGDPGTPTS